MKAKLWVALVTFPLIACSMLLAADNVQSAPVVSAAALKANLPLSFEPAPNLRSYLGRSAGYTVSITPSAAAIAIPESPRGPAHILRVAFEQAESGASIEPLDPLPGVTNYYIGSDASRWRQGVHNFARLRAKDVYPGVDVIYYGDQRRLEFDFVIAPGASPGAISLAFSGAEKLSVTAEGDLVASAGEHELRLAKPIAYQRIAGARKPIAVDYVLISKGKAQLRVGDYDNRSELVIDPVVSYITYLGGRQSDTASGIAVDGSGNSYITGETCSPDFPDSPNPSGRAFSGTCDAYVSKIKADGTLGYTTIIGGNSPANATAVGNGIALDKNNQIYITGKTNFTDLPSPVQPYYGGDSDAFIAILNTDGTFQRLTYLGGALADIGYGIAVDNSLNVAVTGQTCSWDFPAYNGFQPKIEECVAFVTELDNGLHVAPKIDEAASYASPAPSGPYFFSEFFGGQQGLGPANTDVWRPDTQYILGAIIIDPNGNSQLAIGTGNPYPYAGTSGYTAPASWATTLYGTTVDNACQIQTGTPPPPPICPVGVVWENLGPYKMPLFASTEAYGLAMDPLGDIFVVGGTNTDSLTPYSYFVGTGAWILKVLGGAPQNGHPGIRVYSTVLENHLQITPEPRTPPGPLR